MAKVFNIDELPTHDLLATQELKLLLTTYRKFYPHKPFTLTSLLDDLGHDPKDWSNLQLGKVYDHWAKVYTDMHTAEFHRANDVLIEANKIYNVSPTSKNTFTKEEIITEAHKAAHLTAAQRAGHLLKLTLKTHFKNMYTTEEKQKAGRFGGKTTYKWIPTTLFEEPRQ